MRTISSKSVCIDTSRGAMAFCVAAAMLSPSAVLAQTAQSPTSTPEQATATPPPADADQAASGPNEIVVTGTSIRGVAPVGSHVIQLDQEQIRATGALNTGALLATIPQLSSFGTTPRVGSDSANPTNPPALRGLPGSATLSLLNGHRLVGLGTIGTTADPTAIPIAAIERIEVLTDGASATYGSDAVAGVINVILRHDLNGGDIQANYGLANGYQQRTVSGVVGKSWGTGSLLIGAQYFSNSQLMGSERRYVKDDLTSEGGVDGRSPYATVPNVLVDGQTFHYENGGFIPGTALYTASADSSLIPAARKITAVASFRQDIGSSVHLFADGNYGNLRSTVLAAQSGAALPITDVNPYFQTPIAGATSETVYYRYTRERGYYSPNTNIVRYWGASGGADVDLNDNWKAKVFANYGHGYSTVDQPYGADTDAMLAALNSSDPATAFDPFNGTTSAATLSKIFISRNIPSAKQGLFQTVGSINGRLFQLPGGDVRVAFGGEHRWEKYDGTLLGGTTIDPETTQRVSSRKVDSAFAELLVPIFGDDNAMPLFQKLTLNASVRHDHYSDFGSATNPKFGVDWVPVHGLTIRGNYSRSFHAPSLADINAIDSRAQYLLGIYAPNFFTPVEPGSYNVLLLAGGNAALKPEKARSYSAGFDFTPDFAPRLRLSGTYFNIHYTNVIAIAGGAFTNAALTGQFVTFNPTSAQIAAAIALEPAIWGSTLPDSDVDLIVDLRRANLGVQNISGLDYSASYSVPTDAAGTFSLGVDGTYYLTNETQPAPGAPFIDNLKESSAYPRWYVRGTLAWQHKAFAANLFVNHTGAFKNVQVSPAQEVGSYTTVDAHLSVDVGQGFGGSKLQLTFDVTNVFDKDPPHAASTPGFFQSAASPIGRMAQVGARIQF
jgi:iron complex outermembrane receptor protein